MTIVFQLEHSTEMGHYITTTGHECMLDFAISPAMAISSPREPQGPNTEKNRKSARIRSEFLDVSYGRILAFIQPTPARYPSVCPSVPTLSQHFLSGSRFAPIFH